MLELSFMVCSILIGQGCKDVHIPLRPDATSMQCLLFGQHEIAKWVVNNSNWAPSGGYTCGKVGVVART